MTLHSDRKTTLSLETAFSIVAHTCVYVCMQIYVNIYNLYDTQTHTVGKLHSLRMASAKSRGILRVEETEYKIWHMPEAFQGSVRKVKVTV